MDNVQNSFKRFISNKNTVTIIGVLLSLLIIYFGYKNQIKRQTNPITVPIALTTINPREPLTANNVGSISVAPAMILKKALRGVSTNGDKCVRYNTIIPAGSMIFGEAIIDCDKMPDEILSKIPEGEVIFSFPVNIVTTFGNTIMPSHKISLYFKIVDDDGKIMIGKLLSNITVLDVKDKIGKSVFETVELEREPAYLIFSLPEDQKGDNLHLLLRKVLYLKEFSSELIPVPDSKRIETGKDEIKVNSEFLKEYILDKTASIPDEDLPAGDLEFELDEELDIED